MTTYFVSRHHGAVDWASRHGFIVDEVVSHMDTSIIKDGDVVIGNLPVHLAADVCSRGGFYFHLTLDVPPEMRGKELTADDMDNLGAKAEEYVVLRK